MSDSTGSTIGISSTITMKNLQETMELLNDNLSIRSAPLNPFQYRLGGEKVYVGFSSPKMKLSGNVNVSDKFRAEYNSWLGGFFGYTGECPEQGIVYRWQGAMLVNPRDYSFIVSCLTS